MSLRPSTRLVLLCGLLLLPAFVGCAQTPPQGRASTPAVPTPLSQATLESPLTFRVEKSAAGVGDALRDVRLILYRATLASNTLALHIGIQNTSNRSFFINGAFTRDDVTLTDGDAHTYKARRIDAALTAIQPDGGFAPGGANVGDVVLPRPRGKPPFELHLPNFSPLQFALTEPLPAQPALAIQPGEYPVDVSLRTTEQTLAPIELRIRSVRVDEERVTLQLAFVNTLRQGYRLIHGPTGADLRLLDAEGRQYRPESMDESLRESIAPPRGWEPGGENAGAVMFPLPQTAGELRLVIANYSAAALLFDENGLSSARVIAANGRPAPPTVTPEADDLVYAALNKLLARQSTALLAQDSAGYLATFSSNLRPAQALILKRTVSIPFASYSLVVDPDADLSAASRDKLENVRIRLFYTFRDIAPENSFLHFLRYSFARVNGDWIVTAVKTEEGPPFWFVGDVVQQKSDHFMIFTRPQVSKQLPGLIDQAEAAYAALGREGLALEQRYVAFFTANEQDFAQFTNRASLLAGIALWRFEFTDDTLTVNSRAFYVNGDVFVRPQGRSEEVQTTITHELTHLVLSPDTRPYTPAWLAEGAAVYFSRQNTAQDLRTLLQPRHLDSLHLADLTLTGDLGDSETTAEKLADEYTFSGIVFTYLVQQFGKDKVLEFYRSYAAVPAFEVRARVPRGSTSISSEAFRDLRVDYTRDALSRFFDLTIDELDQRAKELARSE